MSTQGSTADTPPELVGLDAIDKLLEHRVRLAICALLARTDALNFAYFKRALEQSDGNLGAQLRKLEDASYITVKKQFENRKPVSWYALTKTGRQALETHVQALSDVLGAPLDAAS